MRYTAPSLIFEAGRDGRRAPPRGRGLPDDRGLRRADRQPRSDARARGAAGDPLRRSSGSPTASSRRRSRRSWRTATTPPDRAAAERALVELVGAVARGVPPWATTRSGSRPDPAEPPLPGVGRCRSAVAGASIALRPSRRVEVACTLDEHHGDPPRRQAARARGRRHRRRRRRGDRRRARARGARGGDPRRGWCGRRSGREAPSCATSRGRCPTAPDRDRHRAHARARSRCADPPRRRARAGRGGDGALPGREDLDRAGDRERLLLRLRVPRRGERLRGRLPGDRSADARARQGGRALRARGRSARDADGARAFAAEAPGLQGRADRRPRPRRQDPERPARDGLAVHQRTLHRPLPRPARAQHQTRRRLQAAVGRRRLLARGLDAHDAHPHLRDRVLHRSRARRAPRAPRAGPRARPPQARARARPLPVLRALARARPSGSRRGWRSGTRSPSCGGRRTAPAATARSKRRSSTTSSCSSSPGTGTSTASTCTSPRSRPARWA